MPYFAQFADQKFQTYHRHSETIIPPISQDLVEIHLQVFSLVLTVPSIPTLADNVLQLEFDSNILSSY